MLTRSADVTDMVRLHDRGGLPDGVTYIDLLAYAAVRSLAEHPALNAHIIDDQISIARSVHLGIGIDAGDALIVGVLLNADAAGLAELSARRRALTERVRAGHADVTELQGSTFTVTSLGNAGIDAFTPIINPPEVAILGAGRIADQPVPDGDGIAWRKALLTILDSSAGGGEFTDAARAALPIPSYRPVRISRSTI